MINKSQQIHNLIIYIIPTGLRSLLPFITIPIFTRILTPEDYGSLGLAMIYAIFMSGLANFGVSLAFERNYFQYQDNSQKLSQLFYSCLVFVIVNFVFLFILTYLFKDNISLFLTGSEQHGILILTAFSANFFLNIANSFYFIYFKNQEKAKTYTKYMILNSLLNFTISLFLIAYLRVGVIGIVIAQLITGVSLFIFLLNIFLMKLPFSLDKKIFFESLKISYPLTPRIFFGVLGSQFDKYMIGLLATIGGVGVYHIGKRLAELVSVFMKTLQDVFNPQVYQRMFGKHEQGSESIGRYLTPFLYISILVAFCIALFSEELITVLTPVSYHGAISIVTILSMYFGFMFFGKITGTQLIYTKKTHITSLLTIFAIGINIALNIPLIMKFGAIGAACATLLAGLISVIVSFIVAQHYYKIHYEWIKIIWIMGTFSIGSTFVAIIHLLDAPYSWSFIVKMTSMGIFLNLGFKYGILSKENITIARSIIRLKTDAKLENNVQQ